MVGGGGRVWEVRAARAMMGGVGAVGGGGRWWEGVGGCGRVWEGVGAVGGGGVNYVLLLGVVFLILLRA